MAAVITDAFLEKVADAVESSGDYTFDVAYFRIGEGGWILSGGVQVVRDPDPTLSEIDCAENPGRYDSVFEFQKDIRPDKVTRLSATSVTVECYVATTEANDDGTGGAPQFWELGIFDSQDTMVAYATFYGQTKTSALALRHRVTLSVARPA